MFRREPTRTRRGIFTRVSSASIGRVVLPTPTVKTEMSRARSSRSVAARSLGTFDAPSLAITTADRGIPDERLIVSSSAPARSLLRPLPFKSFPSLTADNAPANPYRFVLNFSSRRLRNEGFPEFSFNRACLIVSSRVLPPGTSGSFMLSESSTTTAM
jgi:hypothetical protein